MPDIKKVKIVPFKQADMYQLVNDIESYPLFVPACVGSKIVKATTDEIHATLSFAKGGFEKSFTTLNRLLPTKMIEIRLVNGPFRHLEGFWQFEAIDENRCRVSLDLEFEFSTRVLATVFGPIFNQVANMLVDTFYERAKVLYKK